MTGTPDSFDVIVIGGGHAGCEAAAPRRGWARGRRWSPTRRDHRRDVLQSGDRRPRQGPSGPRGRRARRPDGPRRRCRPASSSGCSTAARVRPSAVPGPRPTASSTRRRCRRRCRETANLAIVEGEADELIGVRAAGSPGSAWRTAGAFACGAVVRHHRHLPARPDPSRRAEIGRPGRIGEAPAIGPFGDLRACRLCAWAAEDRHAAAARRHAPSTGPRSRCSPGDEPPEPFSVLTDADHDAADPVRHHPDHAGDPRGDPGQCASLADVFRADPEPRPALLPVDRGQDRPLRRSRRPPDLPGAGRARRHARSIRTASRPRCRRRCSSRSWSDHPRAGAGEDRSGRATPSNTTTSIRASSHPTLETKRLSRALPGRSDQRHHRLRGGGRPGAGRRPERGAAGAGGRDIRSSSTGPTAISG